MLRVFRVFVCLCIFFDVKIVNYYQSYCKNVQNSSNPFSYLIWTAEKGRSWHWHTAFNRRKKQPDTIDYVVGRGFRISFPVSSHDILKSLSTCRVRDVSICGAITNLWMPITKSDTVHWRQTKDEKEIAKIREKKQQKLEETNPNWRKSKYSQTKVRWNLG